MSLVQEIQVAIGHNKFAGSIFVELCKAFDILNHAILLKKLEIRGIRGIALQLMVNYMEKRTQFIKLGQFKSETRDVATGVPQGSKLKLHCSPKLFADDTALFYNTATNMQIYKLAINADKTNYVIFTSSRSNHNVNTPLQITNKQITRACYVKYVGLYIDEYLNWKVHVNHITNKLLPVLGILWRLRGIPVEIMNTIYNSLINSHLQYLCMLKLFMTCLIILTVELCIPPTILKLLNFVFNNPSCDVPVELTYYTCHADHKFLLNIRTEIGRKAFHFQGFHLFNALPESLRNVQSHARFKK
ncbi:hypothetical protein PR048_003360 [Dryococelus australis]|uniref:Reverse transcriptase domain-containing protein n=1 Tax=Dryococelus australis TaxID=614101 RepID=A0ABQ9IPB3_9NEOP|nr:hypothetical protein PR048_003360 [Dryococelus australis]